MRIFNYIFIITSLLILSRHIYGVTGNSMYPNLKPGQHVLTIRKSKSLSLLRRSDIVVLNNPENIVDHGNPFIKRIVGLPGEHIKLIRSTIYANGTPLIEDYLAPGYEKWTDRYGEQEWLLSEDEYLVISDYRPEGRDSRKFGPIRSEHIVGIVWLTWRPFKIRNHT